jgi:hypothetical protein
MKKSKISHRWFNAKGIFIQQTDRIFFMRDSVAEIIKNQCGQDIKKSPIEIIFDDSTKLVMSNKTGYYIQIVGPKNFRMYLEPADLMSHWTVPLTVLEKFNENLASVNRNQILAGWEWEQLHD